MVYKMHPQKTIETVKKGGRYRQKIMVYIYIYIYIYYIYIYIYTDFSRSE